MSNSTKFTWLKLLLMLFTFFSSLTVFSQTYNTRIVWDNQVACRDYDFNGTPILDPGKKPERMDFFEDILFGECLEFCGESETKFTISGNYITEVHWHVEGDGTLLQEDHSSGFFTAIFGWESEGQAEILFEIIYNTGLKQQGKFCINISPLPIAGFEVAGQIGDDPFTSCTDIPITFINTSSTNGGSGIVAYEWDFGNGDFSYTEAPVYTYNQPGSYNITLTITNECGCKNQITRKIEVTREKGPIIECPGVVCENAEARYWVDDPCGGVWTVEGGTIINETSDTVNVVWNTVDPNTGFGYVTYKSSCGCKAPSVVKVPVIMNRAVIQGDDTICQGSHARYTLPQWPSTTFVWNITPTSGVSLVSIDQRNELIVQGVVPGTYFLTATSYNTFLGCEVLSQVKKITVLPKPVITGIASLCQGGTETYYASGGVPVEWEIHKGSTLVSSGFGTSFTHQFTSGGSYKITAGGVGMCTSAPFVVNVTSTPTVPNALDGALMVCPGLPYAYTIDNLTNGTILEWEVTNGSIQGSSFGNTATIIFDPITSGNYTVKVRKKSDNNLACTSDWAIFTVYKMNAQGSIDNTDGLTTYCPSSYTSFKLNIANEYEAQYIEWKFVPENFGNIIGGQNTEQVEVSFNEISGSATGTLVAYLTNCNQVSSLAKSITLFQLPAITFPTGAVSACSDDGFTLSFNSSIPINGAEVTWEWDTGETYTQTVSSVGGVTTVTSPTMSLTNIGNTAVTRSVTVKVSQINSCNGTAQASRTVSINPKPSLQITPSYSRTICLSSGGGLPFTLDISFVSGTSGSIQWYHSSNPTTPIPGATGTSYTVTTANAATTTGDYYAVATASTGCKATSNKIRVTINCSSPEVDLCDGMPEQTVTASLTSSDCNSFNFDGSFIPNGVTFVKHSWNSGSSYLTRTTPANSATATYTTSVPGHHSVTYTVTYEYMGKQCTASKTVHFDKPYEADFLYDFTCPTSGSNRNVVLSDNSQYLGSESGVTYQYYRNNVPITPVTTTKNYTDVNVPPGTYTYKLIIERAGENPCIKEKTIVVKGKPNAMFTVSHNPNCTEIPVVLTQTENEPGYQYVWTFGDNPPTSFIGPNPDINLKAGTSQSITLTVTDPWGCTATKTIDGIVVNEADFGSAVNIESGSTAICEGDSTVLTIANITEDPVAYQWYRGSQPIPGAISATYTATETGSYWAMLYDSDGCAQATAASAASITVQTPPEVSLNADPSVCAGSNTVITATVSDPAAELRWLKNGAVLHSWSTTTPKTISQSNSAGTYTYTAEVRLPGLDDCGDSQSVTITVHPTPPTPTITAVIESCVPFRVRLTAAGAPGGDFNWSTGETEQSIIVNTGGAYAVIYTNAMGCRSNATYVVPGTPEAYLWEVPSGCVNICGEGKFDSYILPPWVNPVGHYDWGFNNTTVQSGTGDIPTQPVFDSGEYSLKFDLGGCPSASDPLLAQYENFPCSNSPYYWGGALTAPPMYPSSFVLHPNPSVAHTTLDYSIETEDSINLQVYLYSVLGVQLWSGNATGASGSVAIPVETLPAGSYLVVMNVNGQRYYENTIIKR